MLLYPNSLGSQNIAGAAVHSIGRLYGENVLDNSGYFSIKSFTTATCFSLISYSILGAFGSNNYLNTAILLILITLGLVSGLIPFISRDPGMLAYLSLLCLIALTMSTSVLMRGYPLSFAIAILLQCCFTIIFMRKMVNFLSEYNIGKTMLLCVFAASLAVVSYSVVRPATASVLLSLDASFVNLIFAHLLLFPICFAPAMTLITVMIPALAFIVSGISLAAHRLFWPVLSRTTFAFINAHHSKMLSKIGCAFMLCSTNSLFNWINKILHELK